MKASWSPLHDIPKLVTWFSKVKMAVSILSTQPQLSDNKPICQMIVKSVHLYIPIKKNKKSVPSGGLEVLYDSLAATNSLL